MPRTFSAGSFSFLKSSTTSQSNIEQNNTVDNVNKNNINIDDNLDFEREVRSLDISASFRNNRRNSNASSNPKNGNKKWLKSMFVRILSRWNDGDCGDDDDDNDDDDDDDNNNPVKNNEIKNGNDGVIMMKPSRFRTSTVENQQNTFIRHGNTHDFYVVKNGNLSKSSQLTNPSPSSSLVEGRDLLEHSSSSVFEKCAKTPRHYAKETEVLGTVGRFTILREREDFDTTYFDTCHCQQKPCRFDGCGAHPTSPHSIIQSRQLTKQQVAAISQHQQNMIFSRAPYGHTVPPSSSSRHSLPLQKSQASRAVVSTNSSSSICVLPQSASSPNLVHLNQRSKNEIIWQNKNNNSRMSNNGRSIIICTNSGKFPNLPPNNGSYHYPQPPISYTKVKKRPSLNMKVAESALNQEQSIPSTSTQPLINYSSAPPTPTNMSKFSFSHHHHPNEPHTTINSHSGRKFEVEWTCSARSSTGSTSSTSSSDTIASSPPSSICSMASSPDQSIKSTTSTLSRRCSTLSSKCGRKFEVTILSSSTSSTNGLYTTSPHSTINSVISLAETTAANTDLTKV